jgi:hypothetical protein
MLGGRHAALHGTDRLAARRHPPGGAKSGRRDSTAARVAGWLSQNLIPWHAVCCLRSLVVGGLVRIGVAHVTPFACGTRRDRCRLLSDSTPSRPVSRRRRRLIRTTPLWPGRVSRRSPRIAAPVCPRLSRRVPGTLDRATPRAQAVSKMALPVCRGAHRRGINVFAASPVDESQ